MKSTIAGQADNTPNLHGAIVRHAEFGQGAADKPRPKSPRPSPLTANYILDAPLCFGLGTTDQ